MINRVVLLLLTVALRALAQADAAERGAGVALAIPMVWSKIQTECVTPAPRPAARDTSRHTCRVISLRRVGSIADTSWFSVRYLRTTLSGDSGATDSAAYDELVLAGRVRTNPEGTVHWHARRDRSIAFLDTLTWTRSPVGVFVEMRICLNGTGGCAYEYLHRLSDSWQPIRQLFIAALERQLPAGYRLHKGQRLNLRTMQGLWPVAREADGNCCPSSQVSFRVQLRGDALDLVSVGAVRPYRPPNANPSVRAGALHADRQLRLPGTGPLRYVEAKHAGNDRPILEVHRLARTRDQ